ncbi:MbeD/MobD family mobilization/exclusion protein, partial [Xenorhabdus bovienii]
MTELETHLLNALKRMEQQFSEQHKASEQAQVALWNMFERTSED